MNAHLLRPRPAPLVLAVSLGLCLALAATGCNRRSNRVAVAPQGTSGKPVPAGNYSIDLFKAEPRLGTAVVLLIDTSGSMGQQVKDRQGQKRPKNEIAREALEHIIQSTAAWKKGHPKSNLQLAIYTFNSSVFELLPMSDFDADKARAALERLPNPGAVCVTDGENTAGPAPDWIAQHLHYRTDGEVEIQFVAFDTSADKFGFLKDVNGHVVQADDGAKLQKELEKIYQERILVEKEEPEKK